MYKSNNEIIQIEREELYNQVWSVPMIKLAKQYGLSDVGLAKICRKYKIPLPGRGYWQQAESGRKLKRTPLSAYEGNNTILIRSHIKEDINDDLDRWGEAAPLIAFEEREENRIQVSPTLTDPLSIIKCTEKSIKSAKVNDSGLSWPKANNTLNICVSPDSIDRAMRIMGALVNALKERGYKLIATDGYRLIGTVIVLDEKINFVLDEHLNRTERELTPEEKKEKKNNPHTYIYQRYMYSPSGRLSLKIKNMSGYGIRMSWSDGKRQRVEDFLNQFIISLLKIAIRIKEARIEREIQKRKWEEEQKRRWERAELYRKEKVKYEELEKTIENWQKSQQIRSFLAAVKQSKEDFTPDSELGQWLVWVEQQADRLDPLIKSSPSILDEREYGYW